MSDPSSYPLRRVASVSIVGHGRVGTLLARALADAGYPVSGPTGRGELPVAADVIVLCVPDREIRDAAVAVAGRARMTGHTSGATPLDDVDFGLHPLQTIQAGDGPAVLHGIGCAVGGRTPAAADIARELAAALGMRAFEVADDRRAAYHAAAAFASNFLVTLEDAAERMAAVAVTPAEARALLAPLVRRTAENWVASGARALTGPIARGDVETVSLQRAAVAAEAPDLLTLFDVLADRTRELSGRSA